MMVNSPCSVATLIPRSMSASPVASIIALPFNKRRRSLSSEMSSNSNSLFSPSLRYEPGFSRISALLEEAVVTVSPTARLSVLVSTCGCCPFRVTLTLPTTVFTPPALAEIPNRSRFCAAASEGSIAHSRAADMITMYFGFLIDELLWGEGLGPLTYCAGIIAPPLRLSSQIRPSVCEVTALTAGDGPLAIYRHPNRAPRTVPNFVGWPVRKRVKRSQIRDHSVVRACEILQLEAFVERPAAFVSDLLHLVVGEVERGLLNIAGTQRLVALRLSPNCIDDAVKLTRLPQNFLISKT